MVAEHARNVFDSSFSHVKQHLKTTDTITLRDMMEVVRKSCSAILCVSSANVVWRLWKPFLECYFKTLAGFSTSKYHSFTFKASKPGTCTAEEFFSSTEKNEFSILLRGMKVDTIRTEATLTFMSEEFKTAVASQSRVVSSQQETLRNYIVYNIVEKYYANS